MSSIGLPSSSLSLTSFPIAPPSTIGTSRSAPDYAPSSLQLEVIILRARLAASEASVQNERNRARTLEEQLVTERQAYENYIKMLEGRPEQ
jgi:hypothetical protein